MRHNVRKPELDKTNLKCDENSPWSERNRRLLIIARSTVEFSETLVDENINYSRRCNFVEKLTKHKQNVS